jgi:signal transduction histidine kinase
MCRAIKDDGDLRDLPVILLTSLSDPADVLRGLAAGADYYLTKPYDGEYLLSQVERVLADPAATAAEPDTLPDRPLATQVDGQTHPVTAGRRQILNLLLSTYGNAVQRNRELIRAQQELTRANRDLEQAIRAEREARRSLEQAQARLVESEKLAGLGQMVAGIAHEINNPLAFVSNNLSVLKRDVAALARLLGMYKELEAALPPDGHSLAAIHEFCEQIDLEYTLRNAQDIFARSSDGVRRIQQVVRDLREFARLDESDLSEFDLNAGVAATVNVLRHKAEERGVAIERQLGDDLPPLTCYPAKVNQVVMNLVTNAIEASPAGGKVTVATSATGQAIQLRVADTGAGIDPAIRGRIFDPVFTTKPVGQGTGLGLSVSYGIVRDHGGTIAFESVPGRGTEFTVQWPLAPPPT